MLNIYQYEKCKFEGIPCDFAICSECENYFGEFYKKELRRMIEEDFDKPNVESNYDKNCLPREAIEEVLRETFG